MKIQTLGLGENKACDEYSDRPHTIAFWKRQFLQTPTKKQTRFDWAYGVLIPLICVAADPIVFTADGILDEYRVFAYVLSATSIIMMAAWLLWGERMGWLAAPLGGLFTAGSFVSFLVGVALLPYSLIGMFFMIGFLGFTPLLSGLVYLRNGVRAFRSAKLSVDSQMVVQMALLAALYSIVIPYVLNTQF